MKNFKHTSYINILFFITIISFSCSKESSLSDNQLNNLENTKLSKKAINNFVEGDGNDEILRMLEAYQNCKKTFTISNSIQNGKKPTNSKYNATMSGNLPLGISLSLNNKVCETNADGILYKQGIEYKDYFGEKVNFKILSNNNLILQKEIYIPEEIYGRLESSENKRINRSGNIINWNSDENNVSGKVFFYYTIFDIENKKIYGGIKGIEDDGSHDLDPYIKDEKVSKIVFRLIRGNLFSSVINEEKTKFTIVSIDNHSYYVD